ncbi:MAG: DNA polymerase III subunit gamma/tau [Thermodesulfobacteriota bacterium]
MSYQVLARKWRPQNFEEVVGQEPITRTLQNAISQGRIAHAYLFSGSRGVGKTSVARILAKALNCQEGPTPHPCNQCHACREITGGSSMDVLEIDGASNRGIEEVRDLREKIKYLPTHGQYKVYIIDEVHMLTTPAFNALLKTLEEPPAHAVFVLATTEPHKVPATILSRCQRYDFRRIATSLIQSHLEKLAAQEGWQIDPEGLALIAREAEGGLRDAQGFLDQVVTFGGEKISAAEIARILGVTERGSLLKALQAIIQRQGPELLELIDDLYNQGHDLQRFYQDLVWYSRHLLLAGLHPEARHLVAVADQEWEEIAKLAHQAPPVHLQNLLSVLLQGEEELKRAPQPRLALEVLLLRLIHLEPVLPVSSWVARLEELEKRLGPGGARKKVTAAPKDALAPPTAAAAPAPEPPAPSGASPAAPPLSGAEGDLEAKWQQFLHYVQENADAPLYGKISKCRLAGMADHRLQVEAGSSWNGVVSSHETRLQELARAFFGPQYSLEIKAREKKRSGKAPATPKKPVDLETLKQQALEIFGGQWVGPAGKEEPQ